jgi:hypothetical protein
VRDHLQALQLLEEISQLRQGGHVIGEIVLLVVPQEDERLIDEGDFAAQCEAHAQLVIADSGHVFGIAADGRERLTRGHEARLHHRRFAPEQRFEYPAVFHLRISQRTPGQRLAGAVHEEATRVAPFAGPARAHGLELSLQLARQPHVVRIQKRDVGSLYLA